MVYINIDSLVIGCGVRSSSFHPAFHILGQALQCFRRDAQIGSDVRRNETDILLSFIFKCASSLKRTLVPTLLAARILRKLCTVPLLVRPREFLRYGKSADPAEDASCILARAG